MTTNEIIRILEEISLLLELKGENPFKARSYQVAARSLETLQEDLRTWSGKKQLDSVRGMGSLSKNRELVLTGRLAYYENLKASIPPGHLEMLKNSGLGPKKSMPSMMTSLGIGPSGAGIRLPREPPDGTSRFRPEDRTRSWTGSNKCASGNGGSTRGDRRGRGPAEFAEGLERRDGGPLGGSLRRGYETVKDIDSPGGDKGSGVPGRFLRRPSGCGIDYRQGRDEDQRGPRIRDQLRSAAGYPREFPMPFTTSRKP